MIKKSLLGWMVLGAAGLGVLLILVNFRIISSKSAVNSELSAYRQNAEASPAAFTQLATQLVVEGDDHLARATWAEIRRLAKNDNSLFHVNFAFTQSEGAQSPLLVVTVKQQGGFWTPVYAHTTLEIEAAYSSNGDVSFRGSEPTQFHSTGTHPGLQYEGHYHLIDRSWGFMSLPGYRDYLAHQAAVTLLTSMQEQLKTLTE